MWLQDVKSLLLSSWNMCRFVTEVYRLNNKNILKPTECDHTFITMLDICACFCKGHFAFRNISVSRDPESPSVSWALNPIRHETTDLPLLGRHYRLFKRGSTNGRKRGRQFQTSCKGCTQPWTESHQGHKRFPDSFWFFNAGKSHTLHRLITGDIHHVAIIGKPTFFSFNAMRTICKDGGSPVHLSHSPKYCQNTIYMHTLL